ncbi:hypothetical protein ACTQ5K_00075 [Niallia sp. Sow4_A1]|nr:MULTISPECIES: hypothetical protein [Bacillaceae]
MIQNKKWNEIQNLLKKCQSDLKAIEKDIIPLEKALKITKKNRP